MKGQAKMGEFANLEEEILTKSVELFSNKGYHETSIRDIAKAANCSLPMLYYYFNSKKQLFERIVFDEFKKLTIRLNRGLPYDEKIENIFLQLVKQRKNLNDYERGVYRLTMKVWLGFEGESEIRTKIQHWMADRTIRNRNIMIQFLPNDPTLDLHNQIIVRVLEHIIERIILLNEDIPDETLKKEVDFIIKCVYNNAEDYQT